MLLREFYQRDPLTCARDLIGCELVWEDCSGIIVETEAYAEFGDEACHTFRRPSARQFIARHPEGTAYVYLNYGMYWLFNVLVKSAAGNGFVLVRALEPGAGIGRMRERRGTEVLRHLCSGPGKLTVALGIDGSDHGFDLCATPGRAIHAAPDILPVETDRRIGISLAAELPWRFLHRGNPHLSVVAGTMRGKKRPGPSPFAGKQPR